MGSHLGCSYSSDKHVTEGTAVVYYVHPDARFHQLLTGSSDPPGSAVTFLLMGGRKVVWPRAQLAEGALKHLVSPAGAWSAPDALVDVSKVPQEALIALLYHVHEHKIEPMSRDGRAGLLYLAKVYAYHDLQEDIPLLPGEQS
eukprot:TRINITY_DN10770_c0_g1_i2.p1 TRINITY_DN10770_c0_g1~~TRINITY_DN10770_c0_g1_i2.p1  ORF type:complete len:143 (+),score=22.50 TRINITY_DN10770_c0_g1_i2:45-473(+)